MPQNPPNPDTREAYSVKHWSDKLDLSPAYVYELLNLKIVDSVKVGGKRLITTKPADFLARLARQGLDL